MNRPILGATVFLLFPFLLIVSGCSSNPPQLIELKYQLNAVADRTLDSRYQSLSVFVHADDQDGFEDINRLDIMHEATGLYWTYYPDSWQKVEQGEETWIGSNGIVMSDYSAFPPGEYRVQIVDIAGLRRELSFNLSPSKFEIKAVSPFRQPGLRTTRSR